MTLKESIKGLKKDDIYEQYTRIITNFKEYEKISKNQMMDAITKLYSEPSNIVDICTTRELKYLKMLLNIEKEKTKCMDSKYEWERKTLSDKYLIINTNNNDLYIPEELELSIKKALKNVDWQLKKRIDELNEILIGYCQIQGTSLIPPLIQIGSSLTGIAEETIKSHIYHNRNFYYYVYITSKTYNKLGKVPLLVYQPYYRLIDEIDEARQKQGLDGELTLNPKVLKTIFYNQFDITKPVIKDFLKEINQTPIMYLKDYILELIQTTTLLNKDRSLVKEHTESMATLSGLDTEKILKKLDIAMDEMPSGALNGFTPNEAKKLKEKSQSKTPKSSKQQSPCLPLKDIQLFYKIYFALLNYTNKKYKINPSFKFSLFESTDPDTTIKTIEKLWDNQNTIITEFCKINPNKFSKKELKLTEELKKGIRDTFIIVNYEKEYTAFLLHDKVYMIKGLYDNIDTKIPARHLPVIVTTTIIPFKDYLIYDGILQPKNLQIGSNIKKSIKEDYKTLPKYYQL